MGPDGNSSDEIVLFSDLVRKARNTRLFLCINIQFITVE